MITGKPSEPTKCKVKVHLSDAKGGQGRDFDCLLHSDGRAELVIQWAINSDTGEEFANFTHTLPSARLQKLMDGFYLLKGPLEVQSIEEFLKDGSVRRA